MKTQHQIRNLLAKTPRGQNKISLFERLGLKRLAGSALAVALGLAAVPASAEVVYRDYVGNSSSNMPAGTPHYLNHTQDTTTGLPVPARLQAFIAAGAVAVRTGTSPDINFTQSQRVLCDTTATNWTTTPPCQIHAMGRVLWARVQFPQPGNYAFSVSHDDEVQVNMSSDYRSNDYENLNYNLPVGQLSYYTANDTTYANLGNTIYAPTANSCAWVRIYWSNNGGVNHLRLRWQGPNDAVPSHIPASAFISTSSTPSSAICTNAVTASGTSVQVL